VDIDVDWNVDEEVCYGNHDDSRFITRA
jgi:hypothetical protein